MKTRRFQIGPVTDTLSSPTEENNVYGSFRGTNGVTPTATYEVENENERRNSRTVPALPSDENRRKHSLQQLTR